VTSSDTDERRALRASARRFTESEVVPNLAAWEDAGAVPRELHRAAAAADLLGVGFPESAGGSGGSAVDAMVIAEEIIVAGGSSGLVAALFTHGIGLPHLVRAGDPSLVERVARPVLAGEKIVSLAVTEPDAGSDVAGLRTRAVRDGEDWVINGSKLYITNGVQADWLCLLARTDDQGLTNTARGMSQIVVPTATPGVAVSRKLDKLGNRCSDTAELAFTDVRVPVSHTIGREGRGFQQQMAQFQNERMIAAYMSIGGMQVAVERTIDYVKQRQAFGKKIIEFQNTQFELAECKTDTTMARIFVDYCIERHVKGELDTVTASMAKYRTSDMQADVIDRCLQLFGGYGYMDEYPISRLYRDARVLRIYAGTNEIMKLLIARSL
jgi:acyl-CoA dehydrogenase